MANILGSHQETIAWQLNIELNVDKVSFYPWLEIYSNNRTNQDSGDANDNLTRSILLILEYELYSFYQEDILG